MPLQTSRETAPRAPSQDRAWALIFACWFVATASALGALFFSEVMGVPPCVLCWYQRICMFPLVVLLPLGLFPFDPKVVRYALPLAAIGAAVALFHVLLLQGLIPEDIQPCTQGVPCGQNPIEWFGFLGIPHLSLAAFLVIIALLFGAKTTPST
ncbi:MAG: disulfide bond formation protein B [Rubrivivax sp.]|nr:disulfide bond formation protein B [Rubrivivax sp.]MDH5338332.1 disulfide bond formation protein B [Rubrivivax sp.]